MNKNYNSLPETNTPGSPIMASIDNNQNNIQTCPICGGDLTTDYKQVKALFELWTDDPKLNTGVKVLTGRLIKKFGYEAVREAFIQASLDPARATLPYVRGILMKKAEAKAKAEALNQAKQLKADTEAIARQGLSFIQTHSEEGL